MDLAANLRQDVREGKVDADRLVDLIEALQRRLSSTEQQLVSAHERIQQLEQKIGGPPTAKIDQSFSVNAEEKRQEARGKKKRQKKPKGRRGRLTTAEKVAKAERFEKIYPEGIDPSVCQIAHTRAVWRLESGRAVLIAYDIYRGPQNQYGKISGVLGRSEFGLEIVVAIAQLVHIVGLSFDKVCLVLDFLQNLPLKKSQADAVLRQLSRHWEKEFDALCTLVANSAIVHADETSWSINSVWAFLSEKARILWFGVHKDAETLKMILDPETFKGIVISDDAAVYENFTKSQKCWAHLLRKAIKLTLRDPENPKYRNLTDELLAIYRESRRVQSDRRFNPEGRTTQVRVLEKRLIELCVWPWYENKGPIPGFENDYRLLTSELMDLVLAQQLFTFVTEPAATQPNGQELPVPGTNNESERTLRPSAEARKTGRTNKTVQGARRRTVITSVLESLRLYLPKFSLRSVLEEIKRWSEVGQSCFQQFLEKLNLKMPEKSILDRLLPNPSD
jgi:transposase